MSIKLTDVEFKEMPEDDSGNIETRGRIILGCSVIAGELDRK